MRSNSASKSSPSVPTITISPSRMQRSGREDASGATSSGKYRFIGLSSRLCRRISFPSRNTNVRKPSHLGSNSQPSPSGRSPAALDSMGASGGAKGRTTRRSYSAIVDRGAVASYHAVSAMAFRLVEAAVRGGEDFVPGRSVGGRDRETSADRGGESDGTEQQGRLGHALSQAVGGLESAGAT